MKKYFKNVVPLFLMISAIIIFSANYWLKSDEFTCDWKSKPSFKECLLENFPLGAPAENLINMLTQEGFAQAKQQEDEGMYYFLKTSNNISRYKVAVIIYLDGVNIKKILIR